MEIKISLRRMRKFFGMKGFYLHFCNALRINPFPIKVPAFGVVRTYHEVRNIRDNFILGRLRDDAVERYLSQKQAPCVIDCVINVGVTARWWFHLNRKAKVFGIDMLEESQNFTLTAIKSIGIGPDQYKHILATLWSETGKQFKVGVSDPLFGDYGLYRKDVEKAYRTVVTTTLDVIYDAENIGEVDFLKIDLEGAAADTLKGAAKLLKKTRYVVFEIHNVEECKLASKILTDNNFLLKGVTGRHLWWEKAQ